MTRRPSWLPLVDLTAVTRDANAVRTTIAVQTSGGFVPWITLGALSRIGDKLDFIGAYYRDGVTDGEHDSAYAMRLDVSHVVLQGTLYSGCLLLKAWVAGADKHAEGLCVPPKSILSLTEVTGERCDSCEGDNQGHLLVASMSPEPDVALWKRLRGRELQIEIQLGVPPADP